MMGMKKNIAVVFLGLLCICTMFGCGKKETTNASTKTKTAEKTEEKKEEIKIIGTKADGENVFRVVLNNNTGNTITKMTIKDLSMTEYPANMMQANDAFKNGEKRELYYDATAAIEAAKKVNEQADASTPILDPQYNIQLTFEDNTTKELNAFPFGDLEECKINYEDNVAFINYTSSSSKQEISTKDAEISIVNAAAAQAAVEAQAAADQAAADQAAADQAAAEAQAAPETQATTNNSNNSNNEEPAYEEPAYEESSNNQEGSGGGDDTCLGDGLFY